MRLDGIKNEEIFSIKEKELTEELATLKSKLSYCEADSQKVLQNAHRMLNIVNNLELRYRTADNREKSHILRFLGVFLKAKLLKLFTTILHSLLYPFT
jgi:hypothetical protein